MIKITINTTNGKITSYAAIGHSVERGICGAVTCLQRTFYILAKEMSGVNIVFDAPRYGEFSFEMTTAFLTEKSAAYLNGLAQFLYKGVNDLQREYPQDVQVTVKEVK